MVIEKICKIKTNLSEIRKALPPPPPLQLNFHLCICTASKLQVTPTKLQVTRSKFTSLTADTDKFQLTNVLFITF